MRIKHLLIFLAIALLSSCVSQRKYNDMYALWVYSDSQYRLIKESNAIKARNCDHLFWEIVRLRKDSLSADSMYKAYTAMSEKDKAKMQAELSTQTSRLTLSAAKIADLEMALSRKDSVMKAT